MYKRKRIFSHGKAGISVIHNHVSLNSYLIIKIKEEITCHLIDGKKLLIKFNIISKIFSQAKRGHS